MNRSEAFGGLRGHIRALGRAVDSVIDEPRELYPNRSFVNVGSAIHYVDAMGQVRRIFDLNELNRHTLSFHDVFRGDGIFNFQRDNGEVVYLTRTPEERWQRMWISLNYKDQYRVRELLKVYGGLRGLSFEEVGILPIQIGGKEARELREKAIYFELDLHESRIECRFPTPSPLVDKYADYEYGQPLSQLVLPQK